MMLMRSCCTVTRHHSAPCLHTQPLGTPPPWWTCPTSPPRGSWSLRYQRTATITQGGKGIKSTGKGEGGYTYNWKILISLVEWDYRKYHQSQKITELFQPYIRLAILQCLSLTTFSCSLIGSQQPYIGWGPLFSNSSPKSRLQSRD